MVCYLYDRGRSSKAMSNGAHQNHLSMSTWACTQVDVPMHIDADAQVSLTQPAAIQLLHHEQMGSTL